MKKALLIVLVAILVPATALAWMGFDAETNDLVEVELNNVPSRGTTIVVHNIDKDANVSCLVRDIHRNPRTVELQVTGSDGKARVLVMEAI